MADEPRDEERERFPSDPYADPNMPPEPGFGAEWEWDPVKGFTHPTSAVADGDEGLPLPDEDPGPNLGELEKPDVVPNDGGVFVHRETGTLIKITSVDPSYVRYAGLDGTGRTSITVADFNANFLKWWRPAEPADLQGALRAPEGFKAPQG